MSPPVSVGVARSNIYFCPETSQPESTRRRVSRERPPVEVINLPNNSKRSAPHLTWCPGADMTFDYRLHPFGSTLSSTLSLTRALFTIAHTCSGCQICCLAARNSTRSMEIRPSRRSWSMSSCRCQKCNVTSLMPRSTALCLIWRPSRTSAIARRQILVVRIAA